MFCTYLAFLLTSKLPFFSFFIFDFVVCIGELVQVDVSYLHYMFSESISTVRDEMTDLGLQTPHHSPLP